MRRHREELWWFLCDQIGSTMNSLTMDGICKRFGTAECLRNVSMCAGERERIIIAGPSGSGKTTLLRILAGLEKPSAGRVLFNGKDVTATPANRRNAGIVFQDYAVYPRLSVAENLTITFVGNGVERGEKEQRLREMIDWLNLGPVLTRLPTELSGGQLQRVAIGKALMSQPKLLLLDEPFSQLDVRLQEELRQLLAECHSRFAMTQVMVTHSPLDVLRSADRVLILEEGSVVQCDSPDVIRQKPASRFAAELTSILGLNVLPTQLISSAMSSTTHRGEAKTFGFRPEKARFDTTLDDTSIAAIGAERVRLRGQAGTVRDLGVARLQEVMISGHSVQVLACPRPAAEGESVQVSIGHEDVFYF